MISCQFSKVRVGGCLNKPFSVIGGGLTDDFVCALIISAINCHFSCYYVTLLFTDRSVCSSGDRCGRPKATVYPSAQLCEGVGA